MKRHLTLVLGLWTFLGTLVLGPWTLDVSAATYYVDSNKVDNSATCIQATSPVAAKKTIGGIGGGTSCAVLPGDIISIVSGTYDECLVTPASGITIRSETDLGAVWKCTSAASSGWGGSGNVNAPLLSLKNKSNITIGTSGHGIDFTGSTCLVVIDIWMDTIAISNITIRYNRFNNDGNQGYHANGDAGGAARQINIRRTGGSFQATSMTFSNNTLDGSYGRGLVWNYSTGIVDSNTDINRHSSQDDQFNGYNYNAQFFHAGQGGGPTTVSNNTISNMVKEAYVTTTPTYCTSGRCVYSPNPLRSDTGAANVTFTNNVIHDIGYVSPNVNSTRGIMTESSNDNNVATYNRIYRVGGAAMLMGSYGTSQNSGNNFSWNSIYDCACGIIASNATNYVIKNNIVHMGSSSLAAAIRSDKSTVNGVWKNNNWYNPNTVNIGFTGATSGSCIAGNKNLATWAGAVGETGQIGANPLYTTTTSGSENFALQIGSPSIHAADDGSDQGYLPLGNPPPATTISLTFPNGGDNLISGNVANINWVTTQTGNCKVELARDGSNFAEVLSASTTCTAGTYAWTVTPPGRLTTAKIKVTSLSAPTVIGQSDAVFNIRGKYVSVLP